MNSNVIIDSHITPTDVKIYVENGTPYLDYTGICYASNGDKIKVHFPKIDLTLTNITNVCASNDKWATFEVIEREVSKEQLEKELGYKLNIKE